MNFLGVPDWLAIIILAILAFYIYATWTYGTLEAMGLKTPRPIPYIGNMYNEFFNFVPEEDAKMAKKYGKTYGFYFARIPTMRTSDPEVIKEICVKEFNSFTNRMRFNLNSIDPIIKRFLFQLVDEEWRHTRNLLTPSFTSGKLKQMIPLVDKCATDLMNILEEKANAGESINIKNNYMTYLMDVIATCTFGIELNSQKDKYDQFVKHANNLGAKQNLFTFFLAFIFPGRVLRWLNIQVMSSESMAFFRKVVMEIINLRLKTKTRREDFLQLMLDCIEDKNNTSTDDVNKKLLLSPETIAAQCVLFLFAGFDTSGSTLTFISYNLATNPEHQDKVLKEMDEVLEKSNGKIDYEMLKQLRYLDMVIYETMRLYPAAIRTDRQCTKDCVINGIPIKKDLMISILIYAVMHDEENYENPEKFDPERFNPENKDSRNAFTFLSFGIGPRNCIGMRFALMEMKMTLVRILQKFRFAATEDTVVPLTFHKGKFNLVPIKPIQLKLVKRNK